MLSFGGASWHRSRRNLKRPLEISVVQFSSSPTTAGPANRGNERRAENSALLAEFLKRRIQRAPAKSQCEDHRSQIRHTDALGLGSPLRPAIASGALSFLGFNVGDDGIEHGELGVLD